MGKKKKDKKGAKHSGKADAADMERAVAPAKSRQSFDTEEAAHSDDEIQSEVSHLSLDDDLTSVIGEGEEELLTDDQEVEDAEAILENKISENLENALHKNSSVRQAALRQLQAILSCAYLPEMLEKWKVTTFDAAERSLKKPNAAEAVTGAKLIALMALQLGVDVADLTEKSIALLRPLCTDPSLNVTFRAECCTVLGMCNFVAVDEVEPLQQSLHSLRSVWQSVKTGNSPPECQPLFVSSIAAWGLLVAQMPARRLEEILNIDLPKLCQYLDSNQVEIRIAAGETLSLLYELGSGLDENFRPPNHQQTLDMLSQLATDGLKYRAKKERRVQRCSFRQIYTAVKESDSPVLTVKFGGESLVLDTWVRKLFYDVCCSVLRGGINAHLKKNLMLREIFGLGAPISGAVLRQMSKAERLIHQSTVSKARTLHRGKQRDKRTANFDN